MENCLKEFIKEKLPQKENEPSFDYYLRVGKFVHTENRPYKVSTEDIVEYLKGGLNV